MKQKIILVDYSFILHQSVYSYNAMMARKQAFIDAGNQEEADKIFVQPSTTLALKSLISVLKRVGVSDECGDKVILVGDGRGSWRKEIEAEYKGSRQEQRDKATFVDWVEEYKKHNAQIEFITANLPFDYLALPTIEADDIISLAARICQDKEVIIVSPDHDFDQLLKFDNVRVFSPHPNKAVKTCPYRILDLDREKEKKLAYKSLMKKIEMEKTDNLSNTILTEEDYNKREMCVSLLKLPKEIEAQILPSLTRILSISNEYFFPEVFSPSVQKSLAGLFDTDNVITYQYCRQLYEKREKRKKIKAANKRLAKTAEKEPEGGE